MKALVEVKNISMNYHSTNGETEAIKDVSFNIAKGEFVSIIGPSGCGKSTLLSIIAGLTKPSGGSVNIFGLPLEESRSQIGYMLQKDCLFEWRNIYENAILGLEIQKKLTKQNIAYTEELLKQYGLNEFRKYKPSELSGGMRQRVALIRTLAAKPELLLLDEPFSALDYQTRLYIADEVGTILKKEKKTAILVTHDISEAISLSERIIVLTKRPSVIKNIHNIKITLNDKTPMKSREAPEFREYFNKIWKELDVHV
jgi:NitT/TauT family transport system ATP-binding protein